MPETLTHSSPAASKHSVIPAAHTGEQEEVNVSDESLSSFFIQCKLSVGAPDDPMELEADAVADKVMRMPEQSFIQRKCSHCKEEDEKIRQKPMESFIQRKGTKSNSLASDAISSRIQSANGSGTRMDAVTTSFMENRFGADFSDVRIHSNNEASQLSGELSARAFTLGNDIFFNKNEYQPDSSGGKHLLAHELTHTIHQGATQNKQTVQRVPFSPWPGQTGTDVANTRSTSGNIIRERVQRTGDPNFANPMPSLLEFDPDAKLLRSTMEINFIPETHADNQLTTDQFNTLKQRILSIGNDRLNGWIRIHAGSEAACPESFRGQDISVEIIATEGTGTTADTVTLGRNYKRDNAGHIGNSSSDWTLWHEMGHIVLGADDEYAEAGRPDERVNESDSSIMASSHDYGRFGMLHARHFSHLPAWLTRRYPGCGFQIIEADRPLIIEWDPVYYSVGGFGGRSAGIFVSTGIDMGIPLDNLRRLYIMLGPRINFMGDFTNGSYPLLAGFRAGLRYRTTGYTSFQSNIFAEGGGVGFTNLGTGAFGAAPYAEGGASLGMNITPGLGFHLEGALGGRTALIPANPDLRLGERTEFQNYFRLGLLLGGRF